MSTDKVRKERVKLDLISRVKEHPELWKSTDELYKNPAAAKTAWEDVYVKLQAAHATEDLIEQESIL
jgi:hypothetical protein